ncbi:chromosome segregation ATPase [Bradyrhizobium sp. AZCC 2262]|uniref:hypothetical protein n=1 Tax=Bradyrhizobium sp. AZCC 2262 TaxID=3117022 RepID=UPI002FF11359
MNTEKEEIRRTLEITAEELKVEAARLAVTAEDKESIRIRLEVTASNLAAVAEEKRVSEKRLETLLQSVERRELRMVELKRTIVELRAQIAATKKEA